MYNELIKEILVDGDITKPSKGVVMSVFGRTLRFKNLPLISSRKIYTKGIVGELRGFMNNVKTQEEFESYGCKFWKDWMNPDGTVDVDYARLLHDFNSIDQLSRVVTSLKTKPHSRKHIISIWDPSSKAKQVPCVLSYQYKVVGDRLSLIWTQRSIDVMIGLPSDMVSSWVLLHLMAEATGYIADEVIMQLGDCHIYEEHWEMADIQSKRDTSNCPTPFMTVDFKSLQDFDVEFHNYNPLPAIKYELKV